MRISPTIKKIVYTSAYKRALKRYKKKHYDISLLDDAITAIVNNDTKYLKTHKAHKLTYYFELHVDIHNWDWLLEYDFDKETGDLILILIDTGNHDELKRKRY